MLNDSEQLQDQIFFSYCRKDKDLADVFIHALGENGYIVWHDKDLVIGANYHHAITRRIENAKVFLCLITDHYNQSEYCIRELQYAREKHRYIVPVCIGKPTESFEKVSFTLTGIHALIIEENDLTGFVRAINGLDALASCKIGKRMMHPEVRVGSHYVFGRYMQNSNEKTPIIWIVLDRSETKAFLLSRYALACQKYHQTSDDVTWSESWIREWLNHRFIEDAFTPEEIKRIKETFVPAYDNPNYHTSGGKDTTDRIFLLDIKEVYCYMKEKKDRTCHPTVYAVEHGAIQEENSGYCYWWLRSPGYFKNDIALVNRVGFVHELGRDADNTGYTVRPAMWVDLNDAAQV